MTNSLRLARYWTFALASLAMAAGCGKAPSGFSANAHRQSTPPPGCTAGTTTKKLRILVMVDNSGSTKTTDPDQRYRVETLRTFIANYGSRSNLSYGFGYFDADAYLYDMNLARFEKSAVSVPMGAANGLTAALDVYHDSIPPAGNTGYAAAFDALSGAVTQDQSTGVAEDYAVVFMSDGQPTDVSGNVPSALRALVANLKATAAANGKSRLVVSTVYFGSASDATSIGNLRTMATEGGGQFVDTNTSGGLSIDDVVTIPGC